MVSLKVLVNLAGCMTQDHDCVANLASNENQIIVEGGEVFVYRDCTECGDEFVTEYEYCETRPV